MSDNLPEISCDKCANIKNLILASRSDATPNYATLHLLISTIYDLITERNDERENSPDFYAKDSCILASIIIALNCDSFGRLHGKAAITFSYDNPANRVIVLDPTLISDRVAGNFLAIIAALNSAKTVGIKSIRYCVRCNSDIDAPLHFQCRCVYL